MDFRVLGPVEALIEDRPLSLGGPRQRALLAYLLLNGGEGVSAERLVEELWYTPPAAGAQAVHTQVSRLRRALGGRIATTSSGYAIELEPGELDLDRFRALLAEAGAAQDPAERSRLLREGDELWHGSPLDGIEVPFAAAEVRALEELRVTALEERIESDLEAGRHTALVSELSTLVPRYPLREELRGQLILALYRSGRQAEALEAFREARRMLSDELGLEPSPKLRELERAILVQDPVLDAPAAARAIHASEPGSEPVRRRRRWVWGAAAAVVLLGASAAAAAALIVATRDHSAGSAGPTSVVIFTNTVAGTETRPAATKRIARTQAKTKRIHRTARHVAPVAAVVTTQRAPITTTVAAAPKIVPAKLTTTHPVSAKPSPPTQTTPAPTKTLRAAPKYVTVSDTFGGTQIDSAIWYVAHEGAGTDLSEHDGRLEVTVPPSSTPGGAFNHIGGHVGTQCKFPGNFDARVDFNLVNWPPGNGLTVTLWSFLGPNNLPWQTWRASHGADQGGEQVGSSIGAATSLSLADPSGALRIARKNGLVTGYFRHNGTWESLTSGRNNQSATIGVGIVGTSVAGLGGQTAVVDFTNFSVTGANPVCPPGAKPSGA